MEAFGKILALSALLALAVFSLLHREPGATWADGADFSGRELPDWYQDAKLGIFIFWGIYSVPAFAQGTVTLEELMKTREFEKWFANTPYASWYQNSMKIEGSPTREHHAHTYGADTPYENFAVQFNGSIQKWDPEVWVRLFREAGAKYVVLASKFHDGFLLWPSEFPNPFREDYRASRDIVGELTKAVREKGLHMGLYYSSGLDWTFKSDPIRDLPSFVAAVPQDQEYADYVDAHWRELIRRYSPEILWADIGSPNALDLNSLFKDYYAKVPHGLVNDRHKMPHKTAHHDFTTQEYMVMEDIAEKKWEATCGIGRSFAYNQMERDEDYLSVDELVDTFVDIVSKNGNLLLSVGPQADGSIPAGQRERLLGLGAWLKINGEAIYGSRYWDRAEGVTSGDVPIRFTRNQGNLYAILLERPEGTSITIVNLKVEPDAEISLLGTEGELLWKQNGESLDVNLPENYPDSEAYVLSITRGLQRQ
jgi:alpha-L-fucosidase